MQSPRTFISGLAIMAIIASVFWQRADAQEKYVSCCTRVSYEEVKDPIIGIRVQRPNKPTDKCVAAVVIKTEKNEQFCCSPHAKWLKPKILEFMSKLDTETKTTKPSPLSRLMRSNPRA